MKTLTVSDYTYELRVMYDDKYITFTMNHIKPNRDVMVHSLIRPLAEDSTVQLAIKDYIVEQLVIVSNMIDSYKMEITYKVYADLVFQRDMLERVLSLVDLAIAYYGEE